MTDRKTSFLITCGGGPGILAQVEALKISRRHDARIILADSNPASGNLFLPEVDARYVIPPCGDPAFIDALIRLIVRENVSFMYSGLDEEMPVVALHRHEIQAAGARVLLPGHDALMGAFDKEVTLRRLDGKVLMPRTFVVDDEFDDGRVWDTLAGRLIIKAAASRGGRFIFVPDDREEYDFYLRRVRRVNKQTGMRFLVQALITGTEFNVSSLHDVTGRAIYAVSRRKFETRPVKSVTTAAVIERNDLVIKQALNVVSAMNLIPGFNNVEIIVSKDDGLPYFIEINGGRTAAQDANLVASGINLTDLLIDLACGRDVPTIDHPEDGLASLKIRRDVIVPYSKIEGIATP